MTLDKGLAACKFCQQAVAAYPQTYCNTSNYKDKSDSVSTARAPAATAHSLTHSLTLQDMLDAIDQSARNYDPFCRFRKWGAEFIHDGVDLSSLGLSWWLLGRVLHRQSTQRRRRTCCDNEEEPSICLPVLRRTSLSRVEEVIKRYK